MEHTQHDACQVQLLFQPSLHTRPSTLNNTAAPTPGSAVAAAHIPHEVVQVHMAGWQPAVFKAQHPGLIAQGAAIVPLAKVAGVIASSLEVLP